MDCASQTEGGRVWRIKLQSRPMIPKPDASLRVLLENPEL
jgi:hypothetical protein